MDDIELHEITENVARSTKNLIAQLEREFSEDLHMYELLGLDKQLRSIRGSLRVEVAKNIQLEERIKKEKRISLRKSETIQNTMMGLKKTSGVELPR